MMVRTRRAYPKAASSRATAPPAQKAVGKRESVIWRVQDGRAAFLPVGSMGRALRHSADWAQAIIFIALAAVGAAILLTPKFGVSVDVSALTTLMTDPKVYATLFGSVILTRLLCAPYWVWRDERNAARSAASNRGMSVREISAISEQASAIRDQTMELRIQRKRSENIDEAYPNLRIADCPEILELFHNCDAKLNGLLSAGKLTAWARLMRGDSRLLPLEAEIWDHPSFGFLPQKVPAVSRPD